MTQLISTVPPRALLALALIVVVALTGAPAALAQTPEPSVELRVNPTQTEPGQPVSVKLSVFHSSAAEENLVADMSVSIPDGWSVSSAGNAQSCAASCRATYNIAPGQSRSINVVAVATETGTFTFEASVGWRAGDESGVENADAVDVSVVEATPTPSQETASPGATGGATAPSSGGASGESPATPGTEPGAGPAVTGETVVTTEAVLDWMKEHYPQLIVGLVGGGILLAVVVNIFSNLITDLLKGIGGLVFRRFRRR